jgi:hypothetical protein
MKNIFKFVSNNEHMPAINPAKKYVPKWYKDADPFIGGSPQINGLAAPNSTVKNCIPVLDSFTTGYIIELWTDMQISKSEDGVKIAWLAQPDPMRQRDGNVTATYPAPAGYEDKGHFVWINPWYMKLPKGYSAIITHPLNRYDLPFITATGVVDLDTGIGPDSNIPFFIKKDFEGIIPHGTPIMQVIPFKRESWKSERTDQIREEIDKNTYNSLRTHSGYYKKMLWSKKDFE